MPPRKSLEERVTALETGRGVIDQALMDRAMIEGRPYTFVKRLQDEEGESIKGKVLYAGYDKNSKFTLFVVEAVKGQSGSWGILRNRNGFSEVHQKQIERAQDAGHQVEVEYRGEYMERQILFILIETKT